MKRKFYGLSVLMIYSHLAIADSTCRFVTWWIPQHNQGVVHSSKITFKNIFTEQECREHAKLGQSSEYIIRMTDKHSDHIVKTKYTYKANGNRSSGTYRQGIWSK
jgi:hypothetical protein